MNPPLLFRSTAVCSCSWRAPDECVQEGLHAIVATKRLATILSSHPINIVASGKGRYGRILARFVIGDMTAGEILVAEGLARPWRGRTEHWCD